MAPPKKKTKEEAYTDFMTAIAADVKDAEEKEQEEAVTAAQDREAREAFEQKYDLHPLLSADILVYVLFFCSVIIISLLHTLQALLC